MLIKRNMSRQLRGWMAIPAAAVILAACGSTQTTPTSAPVAAPTSAATEAPATMAPTTGATVTTAGATVAATEAATEAATQAPSAEATVAVTATTAATTTSVTTATTSTTAAAATKFNLNTVTAEQIKTIPNTGDRMVREFEEYRPYTSILQFRKEIGKYVDEAQVAEYEKYVYVPVVPNDADAATLQQLPGVTTAIADQLIAARPFATKDAFLKKLGELTSAEQATTAATYVEAQ